MKLLDLTPAGLYCPAGDFYIDPMKPVPRAVITHGHSDHARSGHGSCLVHTDSLPVLRARLGTSMPVETRDYNQSLRIGDVTVSLHPAGHIIGSAQIRIEHRGRVAVVTGDYKVKPDGLTVPFEPVACDILVTEATFGLPVYQWPDQAGVMNQINRWWKANREKGITSVLNAYSLGKAQRLLAGLDLTTGSVFCHPSAEKMNEALRAHGIPLPPSRLLDKTVTRRDLEGSLILAPVSGSQFRDESVFGKTSIAFASGWMATGKTRQTGFDRGFVLSDHADWAELNLAVRESGAEEVLVYHGFNRSFARWLREAGLDARPLENLNRERETED
ncbi:MAG: ligase-associated DNA damage response exonuclease [Bacteroidetes bacterium]|nr:ligase-associated DNA damage response exonuclease [Bacteroidota bacterium]